MKVRTGNRVVAGTALAVGLVALVSLYLQMPHFSLGIFTNMESPVFFPLLAGLMMSLAAIGLGASAMARSRSPEAAEDTDANLDPIGWRPVAMGAGCVVFIFMIHALGAMTASAIAMLTLPLIFDFRNYYWICPLAVVLPFAVYILFERTLNVLFPHGVLF